MENSILPDDVVIQILLRLPAKSILRFKCVCKLWYQLFHQSFFISDHFNFHNNTQINNQFILVSQKIEPTLPNEFGYKHVVSIVSDAQTSCNIDLPQFIEDHDTGDFILKLLGSINGVLCICFGLHICLWNPATRQLSILPQTIARQGTLYHQAVGFGLQNNDFSVVRMTFYSHFYEGSEYKDCWFVEVYSVTNGCWREVAANLSPDFVNSVGTTVYLNGSCHWSLFHENNMILSFDFANEVFHDIPLPVNLDDNLDDVYELARVKVVNECVGLICAGAEGPMKIFVDAWVLMEYGNEESWTKFYRFEPHLRVDNPIGFLRNGDLLGFLRNGDFLFHHEACLFSYNLESHQSKKFQVHGVFLIMDFASYVESLFSTEGGNGVENLCNL